MNRTQLLLEQNQYEFLKRIAGDRRVSIASLIRKAIDQTYGKFKPMRGESKSGFLRLAGMAKGSGEAIARNHDRYLYSKKK